MVIALPDIYESTTLLECAIPVYQQQISLFTETLMVVNGNQEVYMHGQHRLLEYTKVEMIQ